MKLTFIFLVSVFLTASVATVQSVFGDMNNNASSGSNHESAKSINSIQELDQNKFYYLTLVENGEVLENPGHVEEKELKTLRSEAKLITSKKRSNDISQQWKFIKIKDNLFMIVNRKYNNYIDVPYGRKNKGETLFGHGNKGGENQQFYLLDASIGTFYVSVKIDGLVLTKVKNKEDHCLYRPEDHKFTIAGSVNPFSGNCGEAKTANYVKQMPVTGSKDQKWIIIPVN